jgi:hypothetical protein
MKVTASMWRVRQIISMLKSGELVPRPEFQRRLVWTNEDKVRFLDTVLKGFPFPEIYVCDGSVDLETAIGTRLLVDGQQRMNTLFEYFSSDSHLSLGSLPPYKELSPEEQTNYLNYDVAVRDLGSISKVEIIEVFRRINATNYSLNTMEVNNAIYEGKLKQFAEEMAALEFFEQHGVFRRADYTRMGDLRFVLSVIITYVEGYFNREDSFESALAAYNDEFPDEQPLRKRFMSAASFIDECGFLPKSRLWKKSDLFTALTEIDNKFQEGIELQPTDVLEALEALYAEVDVKGPEGSEGLAFAYYKAAVQASNDRLNRVRRGVIVHGVLSAKPYTEIMDEMRSVGLV